MAGLGKIGIVVAAALAVFALGATSFVGSGVYDIGADDHHTKLTLSLIESLRDRSIDVRSRAIELRYVDAPDRIRAGARRYASLCAGCHLAPGEAKSLVRVGLYPHPPNLAEEKLSDGRRAFWIVKHGIKMSAMPAWGKTLDDAAIWDIVSFIRKMPDMSADAYRQLADPLDAIAKQ
jgi:mono/diheme cytochrome c family protein